ncbi:uncharacterized protein [Arachis hypogaea]|uniref:uncharacterized protein isoform X1 n=1 Tax=Arachis hypogaea TaxID=3818 RepID=UPI003B210008
MQLPPSCRRFIRVTVPEETWQIVLWWWRNYGGRHWILLLLKGVQFHSLMWRNKNLLCQGGQGQEQEQLKQLTSVKGSSNTDTCFHGPRHWSISGSISSAKLITFKQMMMLMMMSFIKGYFSEFIRFYDFVFFMCRETGQKNISVSRAVTAWKLVLAGNEQENEQGNEH